MKHKVFIFKNHDFIITLLAVAVLLSSCTANMGNGDAHDISRRITTEDAAESARSITQDDIDLSLHACQSVLENGSMLYDTETSQEMYISDYTQNKEVSIIKYSMLDLNGDDVPEMVLWLARDAYIYYGFLVLHNDQNTVYAYELTYRAFYELKADGTFTFSGGAADHGIGIINFMNDTYVVNKLAHCTSGYDTQKVSYYIENRDVSKEEFDAYLTAQGQKQDVEWHEFT